MHGYTVANAFGISLFAIGLLGVLIVVVPFLNDFVFDNVTKLAKQDAFLWGSIGLIVVGILMSSGSFMYKRRSSKRERMSRSRSPARRPVKGRRSL